MLFRSKDVDGIMIGARTTSYVGVIRNLRNLQRRYLAQLEHDPDLALEIRRRIAENELIHALLHGCAIRTCRVKLKALSKLTFADMNRKAQFSLIYARWALARGHRRAARQSALTVETELGRSPQTRKSPEAQQWLAVARALLDSIDKIG